MVVSSKRLVNLILGKERISIKEITAEGWLEIINKDSLFLSTYRKYLLGFQPINKLLNSIFGAHDQGKVDESIVNFCEGINKESRYRQVAILEEKEWGKFMWKSKNWGPRFRSKRALLLHQNEPRWLVWESEYELIPRPEEHYPEYQGLGARQMVKVCNFYVIKEDELLKELSKNTHLGFHIIWSFRSILRETIRKKEERIEKIKNIEKRIGKQLELIVV